MRGCLGIRVKDLGDLWGCLRWGQVRSLGSGEGEKARRRRGWGWVSGSLPTPLLSHLLEGPTLGYSLGAEVQQRLGSAPAAHGRDPGVALLRSCGAAPAPLGRWGVHPAGPGPGRGLFEGVGLMLAPLRPLPRPLPLFLSFVRALLTRDSRRTHPRPRTGPAGCCGPFKTLHNNEAASAAALCSAIVPPPSPVPIGTPFGLRGSHPPLAAPPYPSPTPRSSFVS